MVVVKFKVLDQYLARVAAKNQEKPVKTIFGPKFVPGTSRIECK